MGKLYTGPRLSVTDDVIPDRILRLADGMKDRRGFVARSRPAGPLEDVSWGEVAKMVRAGARALVGMGIAKGDRVAIVSRTRYEWSIADLSILAAGGVSVPIYPTLLPSQVAYILNDSGSRVAFVEDPEQADKLKAAWKEIKGLDAVVAFDPVAPDAVLKPVPFDAFLAKGEAAGAPAWSTVEQRMRSVKPDDVASLVYTSGTTGVPKGCILTHRNFLTAADAGQAVFQLRPDDVGLAFLPLAHSYQRLVNYLVFSVGTSTVFSSPEHLVPDLQKTRPTMMAAVPRIYERIYAQMRLKVEEGSPTKRRIFRWAEGVAKDCGRAMAMGGRLSPGLAARRAIADRLVFRKIREGIGCTRLRIVITGAAAISPDLLYFYRGIGIPILEGYGLTETAAPSNVNLPGRYKPGTVGPPMPGIEQKLDHDGEVLTKGPNVFSGYWNLPKDSKESFTEDGFLRTGDLGTFDDDGYLKIIDRKKELEKLSTGKYVAPVPIEEGLKRCPLVEEAMVVADERKFTAAILQPNMAALMRFAERHQIGVDEAKVVRQKDPTGQLAVYEIPDGLATHPAVVAEVQTHVDGLNKTLAPHEQVKKFRLVPRVWTIARDELTPTLKKKRRNIRKNFAAAIESLYAG
ncbi:MAG: AMP-dependent synthetase/ligase [Methanobacteriota archaeon]